jgi:hypothetical protein
LFVKQQQISLLLAVGLVFGSGWIDVFVHTTNRYKQYLLLLSTAADLWLPADVLLCLAFFY